MKLLIKMDMKKELKNKYYPVLMFKKKFRKMNIQVFKLSSSKNLFQMMHKIVKNVLIIS